MVKHLPANPGDARDLHLVSGSGRSPGVGNGNPLQNSYLEKSRTEELAGYSPRRLIDFFSPSHQLLLIGVLHCHFLDCLPVVFIGLLSLFLFFPLLPCGLAVLFSAMFVFLLFAFSFVYLLCLCLCGCLEHHV